MAAGAVASSTKANKYMKNPPARNPTYELKTLRNRHNTMAQHNREQMCTSPNPKPIAPPPLHLAGRKLWPNLLGFSLNYSHITFFWQELSDAFLLGNIPKQHVNVTIHILVNLSFSSHLMENFDENNEGHLVYQRGFCLLLFIP